MIKKMLIEKSRECHDHKPQPTPDTKRKRKMTKTNMNETNKQMHEKHTDQLPLPKRGDHNAKWNDETRGQRACEDFKTWSAKPLISVTPIFCSLASELHLTLPKIIHSPFWYNKMAKTHSNMNILVIAYGMTHLQDDICTYIHMAM